MSEPKSEPISAETSSVSTGPAASDAAIGPVQASAAVESPGIAPNQEDTAPKSDIKSDMKADAPKVEPKFEAPEVKAEAPKAEAKAPEAPRIPGNVTIMSPGDREGGGARIEAEPASGKRRVSAMAAVVALAALAGAIGGALATAGVGEHDQVEEGGGEHRGAGRHAFGKDQLDDRESRGVGGRGASSW